MAGLPALTATAPLAGTNPAGAYLASLSAGAARETMAGTLGIIAAELGFPGAAIADCPWHMLRHAHVAALRSKWAATLAPATVNKRLSALRQVARHAWLADLMAPDDCERIRAVPYVRGSRLPAGRALAPEELAALFGACGPDPAGKRDAAAFSLMFGAGLRVSEACSVLIEDYDASNGTVRVLGKGNKERLVYCHGGAREALASWLAARGADDGPLICRVLKGGKVQPAGPLSPQAVAKRLTLRCGLAGIQPASPHDLRRSFVSAALDGGADIALVQRLAGHANPATTARYDRRPDEAASRAAELVHVPYK